MAGHNASCRDCVSFGGTEDNDCTQTPILSSGDDPTKTRAHDPLDPTTFIPPTRLQTPSIIIEFCDRCRWMHRAQWVSTELMLTFAPPSIKSVTVVPHTADETAGRFRVWLFTGKAATDVTSPDDSQEVPKPGGTNATYGPGVHLVWDRKVEGGFPELKVLKQRIRDHILPGKSLGHSDK
ncbi:hypothetical protein PUNSTDRAFT_84905 [Punctularia strigosozonata HHB-11173 SS5]|uniref:uncharacterized protein n=1 Tax=Punctularia strigosozonata (strain HHB-11173) TaxID=741275 RepID=UPI00044182BF|nr:uncharacterized protein PUNSTDRAFT_84905 [Punctularia strigosozonata HHB-11173 SS5]EIN10668.1 hypothetical protein PUNSTDRAFT_84905 [Punctularia strigosozonata HHB-11173 SS5]